MAATGSPPSHCPICAAACPLHAGSLQGRSFVIGETGGAESVTLTSQQLPNHSHTIIGSSERGSGAFTNLTGYPGSDGGRRHGNVRHHGQQCVADGGRSHHTGRRIATARQHGALPWRQFSSFRCTAYSRSSLEDLSMDSPFVAEIRMFASNFAPTGWATCDGQLLPISQNTALFSLLGTTYGGDGKSTFALPDLNGRSPLHPGQGTGLSAARPGRTGRQRHGQPARIGNAVPLPQPASDHRHSQPAGARRFQRLCQVGIDEPDLQQNHHRHAADAPRSAGSGRQRPTA